MAKVELVYVTDSEYKAILFDCQGCKSPHCVNLDERRAGLPVWKFNNDLDNPTIQPSYLSYVPKYDNKGNKIGKDTICHFWLKDGKIEYLTDCKHELAGKTVEMKDI